MESGRLNLFREYVKARWGAYAGKIMLSTGVPCPNRQRGGCVYCSAESFTPYYVEAGADIPGQIARGKAYLREQLHTPFYFASFQIETSTAGDFGQRLEQFRIPLQDADCAGLILSTRPDCVRGGDLAQLCALVPSKPIIIELGLQSAREESLRFLNRNHTVADFAEAVAVIRQFPQLELGAHLILGIPGETLGDLRQSVDYVCQMGVQHLKLHHLQVVKGTPLYEMFLAEPFPLPSAEEYLQTLCALIPRIPQTVVLHRLWSTCRPDLLHAPRWHLTQEKLYARLFEVLELNDVRQGSQAKAYADPCTLSTRYFVSYHQRPCRRRGNGSKSPP